MDWSQSTIEVGKHEREIFYHLPPQYTHQGIGRPVPVVVAFRHAALPGHTFRQLWECEEGRPCMLVLPEPRGAHWELPDESDLFSNDFGLIRAVLEWTQTFNIDTGRTHAVGAWDGAALLWELMRAGLQPFASYFLAGATPPVSFLPLLPDLPNVGLLLGESHHEDGGLPAGEGEQLGELEARMSFEQFEQWWIGLAGEVVSRDATVGGDLFIRHMHSKLFQRDLWLHWHPGPTQWNAGVSRLALNYCRISLPPSSPTRSPGPGPGMQVPRTRRARSQTRPPETTPASNRG